MTRSRVGLHPSIEADLVWDFSTPLMPGIPVGDDFREMLRRPHAAGNIFGSALDCAALVQMLLNEGRYGDARLLQPISVAQMRRNQIPGIGTDFIGHWHKEASWGYGFEVFDDDRWPWHDGSLPANGTFIHSGQGGVAFWVDPHHDIVGLYFSHCLDVDAETGEHHWDGDLFQNMVTAAVIK